jgi:hypothetical protein
MDEMDNHFKIVRDYLDEHPNASVEKVSEDTEVPQRVVLYLIKEGRLIIKGAGEGKVGILSCEVCKAPILEGRICNKCKSNLASIIDKKTGSKSVPAAGNQSDNLKASAKIGK